MKAFLKKYQKALRWGLPALLVLWAVWYARPVDIHFLLGDTAPNRSSGLVIDSTSPYSRQSRTLDPENEQEAAELTADLIAELEDLRFHRSPLEPLLRLLPPMGRSAARNGEDGKKDYNLYLYFYSATSEEEWDTLLAMQVWIGRWTYGPYLNLPLYVSHGREESRELGAFLMNSPFAQDSKS